MKLPLFAPLVFSLLLLAGSPAQAEQDERARLQQQRAEIEARHASESQACEGRFAVNDCLDEARARRSAGLKPIAAREQALDAQARQARALAQRERVAERQRAFSADEGRRLSQSLLAPPASANSAMLPPPRTPRAASQAHAEAQQLQLLKSEREAQRQRERLTERQRQLREHRAEVERRQQQAAARGKKTAAPLPVPTAAQIAAAASAASGVRP